MTDAQLKTHVRLWSAAARANGWKMLKGRLLSRPESELGPDARRVLAVGAQLARARSAAPVVKDLRYACYVIQLGCAKDTLKLTNHEIDLVWPFFRLLAEPCDITSISALLKFQRGEDPGAERRVEWYIRHRAPKAYADQVAHALGVSDWEDLDLAGKHRLARMLADRPRLDLEDAEVVMARENEPF